MGVCWNQTIKRNLNRANIVAEVQCCLSDQQKIICVEQAMKHNISARVVGVLCLRGQKR